MTTPSSATHAVSTWSSALISASSFILNSSVETIQSAISGINEFAEGVRSYIAPRTVVLRDPNEERRLRLERASFRFNSDFHCRN